MNLEMDITTFNSLSFEEKKDQYNKTNYDLIELMSDDPDGIFEYLRALQRCMAVLIGTYDYQIVDGDNRQADLRFEDQRYEYAMIFTMKLRRSALSNKDGE